MTYGICPFCGYAWVQQGMAECPKCGLKKADHFIHLDELVSTTNGVSDVRRTDVLGVGGLRNGKTHNGAMNGDSP
jgi:hypothetical protein